MFIISFFLCYIYYLILHTWYDTKGQKTHNTTENGLEQPLLEGSEEKKQDDDDEDDQDYDQNDDDSEENHKPATSIVAAYRLLTPSVKVWSSAFFVFW